jgi:cyanobactin biosynthesis protein (PatB/AcyB/McaB family)
MRLPKLAAPVKRPDIIYPHRAVDVIHGQVEDLVSIRIHLLHGANYNDPPGFVYGNYQQLKTSCGCGCSKCLLKTSFTGMNTKSEFPF